MQQKLRDSQAQAEIVADVKARSSVEGRLICIVLNLLQKIVLYVCLVAVSMCVVC